MSYPRHSVDLSPYPDLVVVYLGYRAKGLKGMCSLLRIGRGLRRLKQDPPDGLLAHEDLWFGLLHPGFRQYWRDFDSLDAFTRAPQHAAWWRDFAREPGGGGIWRETYRLRGGMEAIYSGVPGIGLARFAPGRAPTGPHMSARQRVGPRPDPIPHWSDDPLRPGATLRTPPKRACERCDRNISRFKIYLFCIGLKMDRSHLLVFAAAYLAVLVLPGPGVTALVARVLARGTHGAPAFIAGFVGGALLWFTVAATGLAVVASAFATVFVAIRYAGAAYLLYLAWKLWTAPARPPGAVAASPDHRGRLFLTGLAINLGNPKVIVFFLALLPTVVDLGALTPLGFAELALIIAAIASGVLTAYALAADRARRLLASPRAVRLVNRGSGAVMAGAAISIAAR